jgi:adenine-specific DNA methylase
MTLLEKTLPVERLNPVALAEGNAKKPVYRMHKWWARRLGSVFRMLALAAFAPAQQSEDELWRAFSEGADLRGKVVLDPFMGGGTTVVEALRLGCKVVGVDINPVAWFVTKQEAEPVDLAALDAAFQHLDRTAGARIRQFYRTRCPAGHEAEIMYAFWVKVAECEGCGERVRLFPNHELSRREAAQVSCCPRCLGIVETPGYDPHTRCPHCGETFDPRGGPAGRGRYRCTACGTEGKVLDAVRRRGGPLEEEPHALEGWCGDCGRFFKRWDAGDLRVWEQARRECEAREEALPFPRQAITTEGRSDPRPVNHGYTHFRDMFNARQLLCLSLLLEEILRLPDGNVREMMLAAFSDCLDTNTTFCKYEVGWHKISPFFGLHAYHPIERPTENNVWGTHFGRGTFVKCYRKVRAAKAYCEAPYERLPDGNGGRLSKRTGDERIAGVMVADFAALRRTEHAALLRCGSSERLDFVPDGSVDLVLTDPPYFDNVQYSELADFFYVWLRQALRERYPWFEPESAGHPREILKNDRLGKTADFFNAGLGRVFAECGRVLKDEGLLVFTFHHNRVWAWEGMARLLLEAGFYVSACPIVRSEGKSGYHSSAGNIKYDTVLVCRKRPHGTGRGKGRRPPESTALEAAILADAQAWARRTLASGMSLGDGDVFTILLGKTLQHATMAVAGLANGNGAGEVWAVAGAGTHGQEAKPLHEGSDAG